MKKIKLAFTLAVTSLLICCNQSQKESFNILLIGNSSIYFNNMPKMLEFIASENGFRLKTKLLAYGGYTLQDHLNDGRIVQILNSMDWDFVVLNEQSTLGENYSINGFPRVRESFSFYNSVREFDSLIRKTGAQTIIISLYPRKNAPKQDGLMLDYSYMKIARELKILLAPVSETWKAVSNERTGWELYREDNLHPTPLGSYITASVLFSTITKKKSKPLDKEIFGPLIEDFDGFVQKDSIVSLINMDTSKSRFISGIVFKNIEKLNEAGGYFHIEKPK
ncbi:SGNH/GDSL hydrolase family protein [Maribacter aurantiacus]|uniref:SGNH/GDSL hydrolase family protein n=1 Tax=Maribacter aurantiacus TaxID=1882343 RepID=A0A5R8M510_9FLAO|nr:SGNH/GDSL hydrolase family protein [Maribacter aurantiacus]TLF44585.1 SGNH/GDSL hydrolase family protein [Maribacter aurantiacus]